MGFLLLVTMSLLLTAATPGEGRPSERSVISAEDQPNAAVAADTPSETDFPSDLQSDFTAEDPTFNELEEEDPAENELEVEVLAEDPTVLDARHAKLTAAQGQQPAADVPHGVAGARARNPRYFPVGLPGSGLGGGINGGGFHRLFGLYPSLFGGTYYSMFGGVSQGGPFPYPPVPLYG